MDFPKVRIAAAAVCSARKAGKRTNREASYYCCGRGLLLLPYAYCPNISTLLTEFVMDLEILLMDICTITVTDVLQNPIE